METYRSGLAQFYYVWDVLTGFYSPTTVKRKNWEKAKSIRSEMDKTIQRPQVQMDSRDRKDSGGCTAGLELSIPQGSTRFIHKGALQLRGMGRDQETPAKALRYSTETIKHIDTFTVMDFEEKKRTALKMESVSCQAKIRWRDIAIPPWRILSMTLEV
ncbi:hypothetical protein B0O80DRAFT_501522 [Mortierella sp. GBAus27b]|nr:hypothetical protein B0O80DRAFT_501522 [Mortierella sp. GBAus27b]